MKKALPGMANVDELVEWAPIQSQIAIYFKEIILADNSECMEHPTLRCKKEMSCIFVADPTSFASI